MTIPVIIAFCTLLLISYIFHLTAAKTKIPSVILLLLLGWLLQQAAVFFDYKIPDLQPYLPVLGTIGLVLIVLEGSFELDLNRSKLKLIRKSFFGALMPILLLAFGLAYVFQLVGGSQISFKESLIYAIPLCIISSAIAIPSVQNLSKEKKEFVIYESSLSDILGVIFFNFIAFNDTFDGKSFGDFGVQLAIVIGISFIATISLSFLLSKIKNHIKFVPIIVLIILIYSIAKHFHLPALIFILIFGLFISNVTKLFKFNWVQRFHPEALSKEIEQFQVLSMEAAFVVRSLFFLVFGFLLDVEEILNPETFVWAIGIVASIFFIRAMQLKLAKMPLKPLLFVAPRGLITILLFLSIDQTLYVNPYVNSSLIIQIILLTAFIMMFGFMFTKTEKPAVDKQKDEGGGENKIDETATAEENYSDTGDEKLAE